MSAGRQFSPRLLGTFVFVLFSACQDATLPQAVPTAPPTSTAFERSKDRTPPTNPTNLRSTEVTAFSVSLTWNASSDNVGVASYLIRNNFGGEVAVAGSQASANWTGLQPLETYTFWVYALDAAGNTSVSSNFLSVKLPPPPAPNDPNDATPPTQPGNVLADSYNDGSRELQVTWSASADNVTPQLAILYQVFVNGVLENSSVGVTRTSVYGVAGDNLITVVAVDANGNKSAPGTVAVNVPF
ncbi:MAG TPA: fibronectin type III domain-containing protein [Gemmatimonadaceae bacterium]|nr:fibronectin type III domain-containing protein [Gemmatimonadaceae bacterium]